MSVIELKVQRRARRKLRVRKRVYGTAKRPRMSVFRSLKNIYAQLIDDDAGCTLVEASTKSKELTGALGYCGNKSAAAAVGKLLGERALAKGLKTATVDRNGYRYHGRIKALVEAARETGLKI